MSGTRMSLMGFYHATEEARGGVSGRDANQPMPQYGIDRDYPLLNEKARQYDFAMRLGGCSDPLLAEIDAALRELWDARRYVTEEASRA